MGYLSVKGNNKRVRIQHNKVTNVIIYACISTHYPDYEEEFR